MSKQGSNSSLWPLVIVCVVLMAGVLLRPRTSSPHVPQPLPPIQATWLNTTSTPELDGKIVVLDAWFTDCSYCIIAMPELAKLHQELANDPRVVFMGLTFEKENKVAAIKRVISKVDGFDWPVGYDAGDTLGMLDVHGYPTLFVFDKSGTSVWRGHDVKGLRAALEELL